MAEESENKAVYVGDKEEMRYVLAVTNKFNEGLDEVVIKARGRAISTAVDAAEAVRNRFLEDVEVDDIEISTETLEDEEGGESNVSSITITLTRG